MLYLNAVSLVHTIG